MSPLRVWHVASAHAVQSLSAGTCLETASIVLRTEERLSRINASDRVGALGDLAELCPLILPQIHLAPVRVVNALQIPELRPRGLHTKRYIAGNNSSKSHIVLVCLACLSGAVIDSGMPDRLGDLWSPYSSLVQDVQDAGVLAVTNAFKSALRSI